MKIISAKILKLGDNINTDILHPSFYFGLKKETVKEGFLKNIDSIDKNVFKDKENKIILGGKNFGCGSSRETGVETFKLNRVIAIVADSFSRIFYRNSMNIGIWAITCPGVRDYFEDGDKMNINLESGEILNVNNKARCTFLSMDAHFTKIIEKGGLINYLINELEGK